MLDERWIRALHVEALREEELHAEREPHVLFQASTIGALLDGAYDGDLSFAELAEHGDLGLGTLNGLDGEMIALDGRFYRADVEGAIHPVGARGEDPVRGGHPLRAERSTSEIEGPLSHARAAGAARRAVSGRLALLRAAARRQLRAPPRPLGAAPEPALPAADRGRRRAARLRARRGRGHDGRLPLPRLRRGHRGRRLPPALHQRRPHPRRPCPRLARDRGCGRGSTPPTTSTSSCRRASASTTPTSPPRPTPRSPGSSAASVSAARS